MKAFTLRGEPDTAALWEVLKGWRDAVRQGVPLYVEVGTVQERASLAQKRKYFAMLREIAGQMPRQDGERVTVRSLHRFFKEMFLGIGEGNEVNPSQEHMAMSITYLSKGEMADYIQEVEVFAASELQIRFVER